MNARIDPYWLGEADGFPTDWIECQTRGEGLPCRTVLAFHMLGLQASSFSGMVQRFPGQLHLHAYDQRGHGRAAATPPAHFAQWVTDAEAALARIETDPVHLVGSSMGGAVAAQLCARAPRNRIASLTLIATPAQGDPRFAARGHAMRDGSLERVIETTLDRWFGPRQRPAASREAEASLRAMSPIGFDAAWQALAQFEGFASIAEKLPPTLCLAFTDDLSTPPATLDAIAHTLQKAGVAVRRADIAGTGHAGLLEKPAEVASELAHFLEVFSPN